MKVLVTGGTGVVGQAAVTAIIERGHTVRLLSRHAEHDAQQWPAGVEPFDGSVSDPASVHGSADGCDVVLHLVAIVDEHPPEATFERVNVEGTRVMVREAERAGVRRFIYVSSLGADRGESEYHKSKRAGEEITRTFKGTWLIVRPGNVYGPGDEQISLILKLVRSLPVVPVLEDGHQTFQPIWAADLGAVLALAVEREDLTGRTLEVAGPDRTSMNDLIDRFAEITGRKPLRVPVPGFLASLGLKVAETFGVDLPVSDGQLTMVRERNVVTAPEGNALVGVFHVTPTPLATGLKKLADSLPELLPSEGVGTLKRKRFWADIAGSHRTPEALFEHFRRNFDEITPWHLQVGPEPGTPKEPREGETITMALPMRGHIQVRCEELSPTSMTFVTLEGHPLAGAVRFLAERRDDKVRFEVQVYDRAANVIDWLAMGTIGGRVQNATWRELVENVVAASGGSAPGGVEEEVVSLDDDGAAEVHRWLERLVVARKRDERGARAAGRGTSPR
jgi:uncharacterized protein YbjT (DUF2867 family)